MGVVREKESGGWENCGREEECERGRVGVVRERESRGGRTVGGKKSVKDRGWEKKEKKGAGVGEL